MQIFLGAFLILFLIFITPVFTIMMLNTLFSVGLQLSVGTWFAALWLNMLAAGGLSTAYKNKGSSK